MATCAKCVHYADCLDSGRTRYLSHNIACNDVEERCKFFKNKADFVEVVRCEKCKYCVTHTCAITGIKTLFCDYGEKPAMVHPTHFCSYGKKKNDFKE